MQKSSKGVLKDGTIKTYTYTTHGKLGLKFLEILNFIASHKGQEMTFSSLQRGLGTTTYTSIFTLVKIMSLMKIVKLEKVGRKVLILPEPVIKNFTTFNLERIKEEYYKAVKMMR